MVNWKQALALFVVFVLGLVATFGLGFMTHDLYFSSPSFSLVDEAYTILDNHAYQPLPEPPALEYGMIRGMLAAFGDPHTHFVEPVAHELQTNELRGEYGGIGVNIERNLQGEFLLFPFSGGPAEQAGLLAGDILRRIDMLTVSPESDPSTIQAALRGVAGQPVTIEVLRPPDRLLYSFTMARAPYPLPSVTYLLDPDEPHLGIVKINLMSATTKQEVLDAVTALQSQSATHFVLDLRDNRGGLLDAGIDLARLFLQSDTIVLQQQYAHKPVDSFRVVHTGPLVDLPLAILINHNTASAAEILAGALKANQRALVVGKPTFGKASLQLVFELSDKSSLHVTAAQWWIPGLNPPVSEGGVQPDITIEDGPSQPRPEIQAILQYWFSKP